MERKYTHLLCYAFRFWFFARVTCAIPIFHCAVFFLLIRYGWAARRLYSVGTIARDSDLKVLVHEVIVVQRVKSEDCACPAKSSRVAQHVPMFPGSCCRYAIIAKSAALKTHDVEGVHMCYASQQGHVVLFPLFARTRYAIARIDKKKKKALVYAYNFCGFSRLFPLLT